MLASAFFCLSLPQISLETYMKKLFTIIIILLVTAAIPAKAQLKFGVTTGLNITNFHIYSPQNKDRIKPYADKARPGFVVGPTVIYTIPKTSFVFDLSALYDLRGMKSNSKKTDTKLTSQSLTIPLNIRYNYEIGDMIKAFAYAGPQLAVSLKNEAQTFASGVGEDTNENLLVQWKPYGTVMSMNLGIGAVVMEKVQVRIGYNFAFQNTGFFQFYYNDNNIKRMGSGKMHACQIMVSYLF